MHDHSVTLPLPLLAQALRTPTHLVGGHAALLLAGAGGRLDAEARTSVAAIQTASQKLARAIVHLETRGVPIPTADAEWTWQPLAEVWDEAARDHGWTAGGGDGRAEGAPSAWVVALARLAVAALDERGATRLTLVVDGPAGLVQVTASPFDPGGADGQLAAWLLDALLRRARRRVRGLGTGQLVVPARGWIRGRAARCWVR